MRLIRKPRWAISENQTTPEAVFWNRRRVLAAGGGLAGVAAIAALSHQPTGQAEATPAPARPGGPGMPYAQAPGLNPKFADAGRAVTPEAINGQYNNFYEFGSHKRIFEAAQVLDTTGWKITIDGMVDHPQEIGIEDLIAKMPVEERIYRHRCVEAWSMVVPWIGFPLPALLAMAGPKAEAKFVRFETFHDPDVARGQRQSWYPWPYVEGLTMAEASNDLSLMVIGAYGKVLPQQFGAPLRLHLPWKFGFKSIKSIRKITLTNQRPMSFWEELQSSEYGFWANVNPEVPHPRWSQASETVLGSDDRIPTVKFNGYGEEVAAIYAGMEAELGEALWR